MTKDTNETAAAEAEAIATRVKPVGIAAALERLQELDDSAQIIWRTKGPRNTAMVEMAGILADLDGFRVVVVAVATTRGGFQLFKEWKPGAVVSTLP